MDSDTGATWVHAVSHGKEVRVLQVFRHPPLNHSRNLTPCINQSPHFPTIHHNVYCGASSNHAHRIHVPVVWVLTTGTSSFPGGMESVVQRCAAERRTVAEDGWGWSTLEGPAAVGRTGVSQRSPAGSDQAARTSGIL